MPDIWLQLLLLPNSDFPLASRGGPYMGEDLLDGRGMGDEDDDAHVRAAIRTDQGQRLEQPLPTAWPRDNVPANGHWRPAPEAVN
jgi:hypothetical protein